MRWLVLFFYLPLVSADVLVQAPGTNVLEYQAALKAAAEAQSPSQFFLAQRPSAPSRETLSKLFTEAQTAFLEKTPNEASLAFQEVARRLSDDDWGRAEAKIFKQVFLRLAQLEAEPERQRHWLSQSLLVGDEAEPETGLIPPPILELLKKVTAQTPRVDLPQTWWSEGWNLILLNGQPCSRNRCSGWPAVPGLVRVTFLSDIWQPVTLVTDSSTLTSLRPKKIAWAKGTCAQPQPLNLNDARVFWGLNCAGPTLNLQPVVRIPDGVPPLPAPDQAPKFYRNKWFWVGVGVVTAGIILASNKPKAEREPTTTYGY